MQVDIIIPTYKRYALLQETLESVKNQTYPNWICWISEDGESQQTQEAAQPFLQDERFRYISGPHTGSPACARNRAIKRGNGYLVAVLDDDDVWLLEKLETQVRFFEDNPQCIMLGCNAYRWAGEETPHYHLPMYHQKKKFFGKIPPAAFVEENYLILSSVVIRRHALEKAGTFNESLPPLAVMAEDYELWLRIAAFGDVCNLKSTCLLYRVTPSTYYKDLNREERYKSREILLTSVVNKLISIQKMESSSSINNYVSLLKTERDFYRSGPRFLGRVRHHFSKKFKSVISPSA
jgi:glycosyltransferase involved in cell wall biosynthesis